MRYDFCVIGGGIVGLATARELLLQRPGATLILLEKESELAKHQTGHNSGVIHAGVYYTPGSLKARLCREGNRDIKDFCAAHGIPTDICGKLIVATSELEIQRLGGLLARCRANDIETEEISGTRLRSIEPRIAGKAALLVPGTGIVDFRLVALAFAGDIRKMGGTIRMQSAVSRVVEHESGIDLLLTGGEQIQASQLVACAGLQSDRLARSAGLNVPLSIVPFRGEYFQLPKEKSSIVRHLIYPVPDPELPFLGIHLTRMIGGEVTVGPNAVLGFSREGYGHFSINFRDTTDILRFSGFWHVLRQNWRSALAELRGSGFRSRYLRECQKYCPELQLADLLPYRAGIRAQAVLKDGTLVHDFMFSDTPRSVHVLNAPSPAATAAMPIARMIVARALGETSAVLNADRR
jgi:(S)-2-hydroxyglutarate dehydrogenase